MSSPNLLNHLIFHSKTNSFFIFFVARSWLKCFLYGLISTLILSYVNFKRDLSLKFPLVRRWLHLVCNVWHHIKMTLRNVLSHLKFCTKYSRTNTAKVCFVILLQQSRYYSFCSLSVKILLQILLFTFSIWAYFISSFLYHYLYKCMCHTIYTIYIMILYNCK